MIKKLKIKVKSMTSFNQLAEVLGSLDPWWMIAFGLILIIVDWIYLSTDALMVTGVAIIMMAGLNAIGLPNTLQLWLCPVTLLIAFAGQRRFFNHITSNKSNYQFEEKKYTGMEGVFIMREEIKNESESFFFENKSTIPNEVFKESEKYKICKVKLIQTGEVFSAVDESGSIKNGENVFITGEINGALVVKKGD